MSSAILHFLEGPAIDVVVRDGGIDLFAHEGIGMRVRGAEMGQIPWFEAYAKKMPMAVFSPVDFGKISPFILRVLSELKNIEWGKRLTYGELAAAVGCPKGARAVGAACGKNPYPLVIPCHRVVGAKGLGGFSSGLEVKKRLLAHECGTPFAYP